MNNSPARHCQILLLACIAGCFSTFAQSADKSTDKLTRIELDLASESAIEHLSPLLLEQSMANSQNLVIFDVREEDEYSVSHLNRATRVDPAMSGQEFIERYGEQLQGKKVVFYCSTGRRSTALAERVKTEIDARHSDLPVPANLRGGIFRWHNNQQTLFNNEGRTEYVHPYNWWWKRLLLRKDFTSYEQEQP